MVLPLWTSLARGSRTCDAAWQTGEACDLGGQLHKEFCTVIYNVTAEISSSRTCDKQYLGDNLNSHLNRSLLSGNIWSMLSPCPVTGGVLWWCFTWQTTECCYNIKCQWEVQVGVGWGQGYNVGFVYREMSRTWEGLRWNICRMLS